MNIDVKQLGDVQILQCKGSLDADTVTAFKKITYDLVEQGNSQFVVDCTNLNFVDSMGLGVLISLLRRVRQKQGDVKVAALNDDVKTIFEITRLHRLFEVCQDADSAIGAFK